MASFNPRPRVAGDKNWKSAIAIWERFNPRPRVAGDAQTVGLNTMRTSFNPRPRVAGDVIVVAISARMTVSIHARAWRATRRGPDCGSRAERFQSTPARGGRRSPTSLPHVPTLRFNPRPRVAGDRSITSNEQPTDQFQSTPARGGRLRCARVPGSSPMFQSTPARGGRLIFRAKCRGPQSFQSTPARGGRRFHRPAASLSEPFQSTPARGGRLAGETLEGLDAWVSIHARAGRATHNQQEPVPASDVSIHARAWRATFVQAASADPHSSFNPRPRVAGD